jgi:hypothetical protein
MSDAGRWTSDVGRWALLIGNKFPPTTAAFATVLATTQERGSQIASDLRPQTSDLRPQTSDSSLPTPDPISTQRPSAIDRDHHAGGEGQMGGGGNHGIGDFFRHGQSFQWRAVGLFVAPALIELFDKIGVGQTR